MAINLVNVGLTLAFVLGPRHGARRRRAGGALRGGGRLALGLVVWRGSAFAAVPGALRDLRDAAALRRTLSVNLDVILRTLA